MAEVAPSNSKIWLITLSGTHPIESVQSSLLTAGLQVQQVLKQIQVVIAEGSDEAAESIRGFPGIADVSENPSIGIAPPGSILW